MDILMYLKDPQDVHEYNARASCTEAISGTGQPSFEPWLQTEPIAMYNPSPSAETQNCQSEVPAATKLRKKGLDTYPHPQHEGPLQGSPPLDTDGQKKAQGSRQQQTSESWHADTIDAFSPPWKSTG
jgi:hypothetical protein